MRRSSRTPSSAAVGWRGSPARSPRLLLLDNYDSFTWNLAQYLRELKARVRVVVNDRTTPDRVRAEAYDAVVISPGPGRPEDAGITLDLIRALAGEVRILGVCLGHQAIARAFGGRVVPAPTLVHGKTSPVFHDGRTVFSGLPNPFRATRYHSLTVDADALPEVLEASARTKDGVVMGLRHRELPIEGVQFHPESILTTEGKRLLANFLESVAPSRRALGAATERGWGNRAMPTAGRTGPAERRPSR